VSEFDDVCKYLSEWRNAKDIREKFNLSNSQFFHLMKWGIKGGFLEKIKGNLIPGHTNKSHLYRAK